MADKKEKDAPEKVEKGEGDAAAQSADKTKSMVLILIILAVVVMLLTPVITIFAIRAIMPKDAQVKEAAEEEKKTATATEIVLPTFKTNIADSMGTRYAQVDVVVEVSDANMAQYFNPKSKENPNGMQKKMVSSILNILADKNLSGLLSKDAKSLLAKEIKNELNEMLQKKTEGVVTEVYFPSFLVQ